MTYKNQPAIERSKGRVPLAGTSHLYRVKRILWPQAVQSVLQDLLIPTSLHVSSGHSLLGDIRVDADELVSPHVVCDAARLPFADQSFNSVLCDPPYNGRFQWNHGMLSELSRVARKRIIFQHWFIPADRHGRWKKYHKFRMAAVYAWQPKTYFGRAQIITVFDAVDVDIPEDSAFAASPACTTSSGPALQLCDAIPTLRCLRSAVRDRTSGSTILSTVMADSYEKWLKDDKGAR